MPGADIQKLIQAFPQALLTKVEIQMQHKDPCTQANCKSHGMLSELYITCFLQKLSETVLRDLCNEKTRTSKMPSSTKETFENADSMGL